ncbi:MAG: GNAT family N-acetyltransferase [Chloroflexota bacterium]
MAVKRGPLFALTHQSSLAHPWPRAFSYQTEFFAPIAQFANAVVAIQRFFEEKPREHVFTLYGDLLDDFESLIQQNGYQLAWSNVLFHKRLELEGVNNVAENIRPLTLQDVPIINQLDPDNSSVAHGISDSFLHEYVIEKEEAAVGKAQMVLQDSKVAYVSDMFVQSTYRGQGLGRQLLHHLHQEAKQMGADDMVLIPSLMTRQMRFYEKFGYQPDVSLHLLIPTNSV